ncbi:acyl-CoA thioesterase [Isoptericola halotolerans]|uniref:YbgC/YbaW family acyl-CoA thioester hydrolase n=2 Tax=Isoptericola halotolerans TaxID=300560 RepID=A0ABX2AAH7_9MICO|nr:acyl-CoA thioesterase [Isoptericola halotolerans]NOV99122.1 YbgC/YbaW family acyl-CoA thioester hydrolase [Isoptericola halotolerans]
MTRMIQLAKASLLPRKPVPGRGLLDASTTVLRVHPGDMDLYLHVNNGSYLQMMDVARSNLIADLGGYPLLKTQGWYPVVAASTMTYKRSLQLFDRVEISTRVLGWDARVVYIEQVFTCRDSFAARGWVAGRFLGKDGSRIDPADVVALLGKHGPVQSPALPDDVAAWARSVDVAHREAGRA